MQENWLSNPVNFLSSGVVRLILILLLGGGDTGFAIYARLTNPKATRVGFSAHLGGFVAGNTDSPRVGRHSLLSLVYLCSGVLVGIPTLRNLEVERWEKVCFWVCIVLFSCFAVAAVLFNVFCAKAGLCPAPVF
ncbi:Rhomboid protein [Fasciola hepatica]|uniref:Rhomboid protein n=1 Tax=Fasciola hepatica TaxID=6192 RepID=A0A4E0S480_FASHE|nr:Rhomboid protein [Fasciola hepatica]